MMKNLTFILGLLLLFAGCRSQQKPVSLFLDNGYQEDSVYICGQVLNHPEGGNFLVHYSAFVEDENVRLEVKPDSLGNFRCSVPVINSTQIVLAHLMPKGVVALFAEPGEEIGIHADWEKQTLTFSGKYAKGHQDAYDYRCYVDSLNLPYSFVDLMDRNITHEECFLQLKSEWAKNDSLLNAYRKAHPQMSERAVFQNQVIHTNHFAFQLMQRRFTLSYPKHEVFPEAYLQKMDSVFQNLPRPYTLMYTSVFRDYLDYYYEQHQQEAAPNMMMLFDYIKENKGVTLTKEQQMDYEYLNSPEISRALSEAADALRQNPAYEAALIERWYGGVELVSMPDDLKELMYAFYHYFHLNHGRVAMCEENYLRFHSLVKNPVIARPVVQLQEKLAELAKMSMGELASLMGYEHLKDCKTGEELYREILKPYQGKVVYLDVWGTWCSPCKQQMKYAPAIKEAMKGKDVVFLYLANRSLKASWENIIKEYGLLGEQTVHYNLPDTHQELLEQYLQVKAYPTYLLIDRNGNIVDRKPPRPSSGEELVDYLNDCLK